MQALDYGTCGRCGRPLRRRYWSLARNVERWDYLAEDETPGESAYIVVLRQTAYHLLPPVRASDAGGSDAKRRFVCSYGQAWRVGR